MNNAQRTPAEGIEPWKDTRAEARAKAQAALEELRTSILWKVASQNRKDAQARHAPRYIGHPCPKHDNAERYTSTGHCVICAREIRDEVRGAPVKPRLDRKLRRKAARTLLLSNRPRLNFEQGVDAS
jgi:hypothetical protein